MKIVAFFLKKSGNCQFSLQEVSKKSILARNFQGSFLETSRESSMETSRESFLGNFPSIPKMDSRVIRCVIRCVIRQVPKHGGRRSIAGIKESFKGISFVKPELVLHVLHLL